jgi:hypothetical protein
MTTDDLLRPPKQKQPTVPRYYQYIEHDCSIEQEKSHYGDHIEVDDFEAFLKRMRDILETGEDEMTDSERCAKLYEMIQEES